MLPWWRFRRTVALENRSGMDALSFGVMCRRRSRSIVVAALVVVLGAAACDRSDGTGDPLSEAEAAAAGGDWVAAFTAYRAVASAHPDDEAAVEGVATSALHLVDAVPDLPVATEVALLRWLEGQEQWDDVLSVLGASVVAIPAGWGPMGSDDGAPDERPAREVYLDAYLIDRYEVTNLEYAAFLVSGGEPPPVYWTDGSFPSGAATQPVVGVSWRQANSYCEWVGKRLPTEAEWERACRGTDGLSYPWGDHWEPTRANVTMAPLDDPDDAWAWLGPGSDRPAALASVGEPLGGSSPFSACNLADNASEWVADWYDPAAYTFLPAENPIGEGPEWNHSIRGGAWLFRHSDSHAMIDKSRCASRNSSHSADDPRVGFRCAAPAPGERR